VLGGTCWLLPAGAEPVRLAAGDIVLLPREPGHALADEPGSPLVPFQPGRRDRHDEPGAGAVTELLCGAYTLNRWRPHPPLAYLTWWRMAAASRLLRETDGPLSAVARRCGYDSEFAFAKAFKREFAVTPGAFRRAADLLAADPETDPGIAPGRQPG
jgi:hypothetical protein